MTATEPNANDEADDNKKNSITQDSMSTTSAATTTKRTVIKIGGMHCAGCVSAIQGYILDLPGISQIEVNLANEKATLVWYLRY
ncbi:MAG: heavy metal-associated domain-containing protein [Candidatus Nitrosopolaris sp.]